MKFEHLTADELWRLANSADPDQTAHLGSTQFTQACLSESLG